MGAKDLNASIETFKDELGSRVTNCLLNHIRWTYKMQSDDAKVTLADVIKLSAKELLRVPNFGKVSLVELREFLANSKLSLSGEVTFPKGYIECPHCDGYGRIRDRRRSHG